MNRGFLRPVTPRDPREKHRAASALELLTDLCFVVAIAQSASSLHHAITEGHASHGLGYFAIGFFAIFWAWLNFAWFNSAYDNDDVIHRVLTLVQILGSLILAAGVPRLFDGDFTLAIVGYVLMRAALVVMWLRVASGHPERRATAMGYVYGLVAVQAAWVAALLVTSGDLPVWLFLALAAADFVVPMVAERAGSTPWHPHHIAERYGLLFLIVLGETILSVTLALQGAFDADNPPAQLALVAAGGVLVTFSAWWLYFSRDSADLLTGNDVAYLWGFGHLLIFGSAAAVGAGLAARVGFYTSAEHHVSDVVSSAFVTGPVAVFLVTLWLLSIRLHDASIRTWGPFAVAVGAVIAVTWVPSSELWVGLIMVALLVVELRVANDAKNVGPRA